ncbi:MAG: hypothetical protein ACK50A_01705 [Sphingobacteriaceae bacterium]
MLKRIQNSSIVLMYIGTILLFNVKIKAQSTYDSLKIKQPKHYFKTLIFVDSYNKANQNLSDTVKNKFLNDRLKTYGLKQFNLGFYTPIYTHLETNADTSIYANSHYLLTGNFLTLQPTFNGLQQHTLMKFGLGLRIIHNTGKKGVWFIDISPFVTKDITFDENIKYWRLANSFIYSHNFSDRFNMRVGLTKSFLWGNRNYLPYLGFRIGRLDRVHFSLQFPKNMSLNIPMGDHFRLSIFSKPQGGMYLFSNKDSVYYFNDSAKYFHFTHYEILSGLRLDVVFNKNIAAYISFGSSTRNNITFYSQSANADRPKLPYKRYFYEQNLKTVGFFNFGLVWRFGKTKSFYNIRNLYDAYDLNKTNGVGDVNLGPGNIDIPVKQSIKRSNLNLADVQDLIDANDN